jgi:hypothetical protein
VTVAAATAAKAAAAAAAADTSAATAAAAAGGGVLLLWRSHSHRIQHQPSASPAGLTLIAMRPNHLRARTMIYLLRRRGGRTFCAWRRSSRECCPSTVKHAGR